MKARLIPALLKFTSMIIPFWPIVGFFGLLAIVFGLVMLPHRSGYFVMILAGVLLVMYAVSVEAWVFSLLNAVFIISNIKMLYKSKDGGRNRNESMEI